MDKEKIAEIKGWLREAKLNDCNEYIVIAINKKHNIMVGAAGATFENMLEMIGSFAKHDPAFKDVLLTAAGYFVQKDTKNKEEGQQ